MKHIFILLFCFLFNSIAFAISVDCEFYTNNGMSNNSDKKSMTLDRNDPFHSKTLNWDPKGIQEFIITLSWLPDVGSYHLQINDVIGRTDDGQAINTGLFNGLVILSKNFTTLSANITRYELKSSVGWICVEKNQ